MELMQQQDFSQDRLGPRAEVSLPRASGEWKFLCSVDAWHDPEICQLWEESLAKSENFNLIYQSPQWLDFMRSGSESCEAAMLAVYRDESGGARCLTPLC